jgi:hypothetical protein
MPGGRPNSRKTNSSKRFGWYRALTIVFILCAILATVYLVSVVRTPGTSTENKPIILYINQGNGAVNESNFDEMLSFASSHGFNTIFFQVYREGSLLFDTQQLEYFVNQTHAQGMQIFFSIYLTSSTQALPTTVYGLGEDGISLDMSTLNMTAQETVFIDLTSIYHGESAVTTTDLTSTLRPDLLVIETYGSGYDQYIKPGVIASVGVFDTTNKQDYENQFEYALQHSDGVMVFDYAGLMKSGY